MTDICAEKTCRCCLSLKTKLYDMAATILTNKKLEISTHLLEEYFLFSNIDADRNEKFMACITCYRKLEVTFVFREICKKSNEVFQRRNIENGERCQNLPEKYLIFHCSSTTYQLNSPNS
jgi:hypothetical protein